MAHRGPDEDENEEEGVITEEPFEYEDYAASELEDTEDEQEDD